MGFFDNLGNAVQDKAKQLYKQATGHRYDDDFRKYKMLYEFKENYELESMWNDLNYNKYVNTYAERMAIKSLMDDRGMEYDND